MIQSDNRGLLAVEKNKVKDSWYLQAVEQKSPGMSIGNCALRGSKVLFCGRGLKFFHPQAGTNSKTALKISLFPNISCRFFFSTQYSKFLIDYDFLKHKKRIFKLITDGSASSWHHFQGKVKSKLMPRFDFHSFSCQLGIWTQTSESCIRCSDHNLSHFALIRRKTTYCFLAILFLLVNSYFLSSIFMVAYVYF